MTTRTLPKTGKRQTLKLKYLTITGLMAAMITIMTAYICHIPTGINGGYIHFGDSLIYLAAAILPTPYALA
ncbi:MAG: ECF transporter S component, partial [Lachnospiraceae bacterium]|nr:ECF transporter S component [Lachnospiraceae bacterium]